MNGWRFRPDCPGQLAELHASLPGVDRETRKRLNQNTLVSAEQVLPRRMADLFAEARGDKAEGFYCGTSRMISKAVVILYPWSCAIRCTASRAG